jgi:hypothetical protein
MTSEKFQKLQKIVDKSTDHNPRMPDIISQMIGIK